jgi:hypothetical protein
MPGFAQTCSTRGPRRIELVHQSVRSIIEITVIAFLDRAFVCADTPNKHCRMVAVAKNHLAHRVHRIT